MKFFEFLRTLFFLFTLPNFPIVFAASPLPWDQVPREVKQAVTLSAQVTQNQFTNSFNGTSGGSAEIEVLIETLGDFKLFKDKLSFFATSEPDLWNLKVIETPEVKKIFDPLTKGIVDGYSGQLNFRIRFELKRPAPFKISTDSQLPLAIGFQACSNTICLFPVSVLLPVPLSPASPTEATEKDFETRIRDRFQAFLKTSSGESTSFFSFRILLLLFLAGVLTAFTPCVYPLYPITLGLFSRWALSNSATSPNTDSRLRGFFLVLFYCGGITLSYALIGLAGAASGALFGSLTQTPGFLISIGFLVLFSALVFSGALNFSVLDRIQNISSKWISTSSTNQSNFSKKQFFTSFAMGSTLGLVASPCVGPVLIVLLSWLSATLKGGGLETYLRGFGFLSVFGLGMSFPLLVLGHFAFTLGKTPRLGFLAPTVKKVGTGLMLLSSLFFLVPGFSQLLASKPQGGLAETKNFPVYTLETWKKNKPSVLDFRADWCAACIDLEQKTFTSPSISRYFETGDFDFVRVDLTQTTPENNKIISSFGLVGLPTVLITDTLGNVCQDLSLFGFEDAASFEKRIKSLPATGCSR